MNSINFTYDWDKLNDHEFTTIRSWNASKEEYYLGAVGTDFRVMKVHEKYPFRNERILFTARLTDAKVVLPRDISLGLLYRDVMLKGTIDEKWQKKILAMEKALVLTFLKLPIGTQETLGVA